MSCNSCGTNNNKQLNQLQRPQTAINGMRTMGPNQFNQLASKDTDCEQFRTPAYNPCIGSDCNICAPPRNPCANPCCNTTCVDTCCPPCRTFPRFKIQNLDSNIPALGLYTDPDAINSWGIAIVGNQMWITNYGSNTLTTYDLGGNKLTTVASIIQPTGIAFNNTLNFSMTINSKTGPVTFIIASASGRIFGYNPSLSANTAVDLTSSQTVLNQITGAAYTGVAISGKFIYAADFGNNKIQVFNETYEPQSSSSFPFTDGSLTNPVPSTFAPFNIVNIGNLLYVTYAPVQTQPNIPTPGVGNGYINVFTKEGVFVRRLITGGALNDPWAIIPAPYRLGFPLGSFLIGNAGDGLINVYDSSGTYFGTLKDTCDSCIIINGLHGLANNPAYPRLIYFAAGPNGGTYGLTGVLIAQTC